MSGASAAATVFSPVRLMTGTGGLSACQALWDCWYNVATSLGNLSTWTDVRGSSAPASAGVIAPFATGTKPTVAAGFGSPVVVSSGGATMSAPSNNSLASTGTGTVMLIASSSHTGGTGVANALCGIDASQDNYVATSATPNWSGISGTGDTPTDSGVASSGSVVRVVIAMTNGTTGTAAVANHALQTSTIGHGTNASAILVIGTDFPTNSSGNQVSAYAVMYTTAIWTAVQLAYAGLYGQRRHGAVMAS